MNCKMYVYESESYLDSEKKQPRNRRKLIGKLDEDGNVVPTGNRGRKRKDEIEDNKNGNSFSDQLEESLEHYKKRCREMETETVMLKEQIRKLEREKGELLSDIKALIGRYS